MTETRKVYKDALIVWWLCVVLAVLLWYRNALFDRFLCFIILIIGVINLLLYALVSGADPSLVSQIVLLAIMIMPLILSIGVLLISTDSPKLKQLAFVCTILSLLAFLGALMTVISCPSNTFGDIYDNNCHVILTRNDGPLLGLWGYVFVILLILGFILLLSSTNFNAIGLYLVIGFIFAVFLYASFTPVYWMSSLPYIGSAFSFFLWFAPLINLN
jgi:hypothetical protein